ncbi:MAG: hypothetical protein PUF37_05790 [Prevotellaceae bacterium]|nr:hypothetical protein [Prevotellaceae bacterium]
MEYSEEDLKKIRELAEDLMTPAEIGTLLGYEDGRIEAVCSIPGNAVRNAYLEGASKTIHEINKLLLNAAMAGSPFALQKVCEAKNEIQGIFEL